MKEYQVKAVRWDHGWELHIDDDRTTQSHTLADAERMVRDYLEISEVADAATAVVRIIPEVPGVSGEIARARAATASAAEAQQVAAKSSRDVVVRLQAAGLNGADIARVMGVTRARVYQLAKDNRSAITQTTSASRSAASARAAIQDATHQVDSTPISIYAQEGAEHSV